ncbi:hypothetical protein [Photobacterium aquimaris]|uniref:hypothetical protein n=1 Tax=Photobacterium aquimaris TaxID=512643 RepID=UPI000AF6FD94|nr:hypothetical protein [Photobacterium aquimaris]
MLTVLPVVLPRNFAALIANHQRYGWTISQLSRRFNVDEMTLGLYVSKSPFTLTTKLYINRVSRGKMRVAEDCLEKHCSRCKEFLPYTLEFFNVHTRSPDGCYAHCLFCEQERKRLLRR